MLHYLSFVTHRKARTLLRSLTLNVSLSTALLRLAGVVNLLVALLLLAVARELSGSTANSALDTVGHAAAEVVELALRLHALAGAVLLDASLLQAVVADQPADELLAGADGLVPLALLALRVVLGHGARAGRGVGAHLGGSVGDLVLGGSLVTLVCACRLWDATSACSRYVGAGEAYLLRCVASERAVGSLGGTRDVVVGGAEGALVGVRHDCNCFDVR